MREASLGVVHTEAELTPRVLDPREVPTVRVGVRFGVRLGMKDEIRVRFQLRLRLR